jgi:pyruvate,water dikinase
VEIVGGKNSSLGEMVSQLKKKGIRVPDGFATTSEAYFYFLRFNNLVDELKELFSGLDHRNIKKLQQTGKRARTLILKGRFPSDLQKEIALSYNALKRKEGPDVAVRSSATAEDLPGASFAGQHETFLNVKGEKEVLLAVKKCFASLFNDRAIAYRQEKGFDHFKVALSAGVQKMVRSDSASSGIIFTLDTESGFRNVVLLDSVYGVGEMIVKGKVIPDEFYIFKPTLHKGTRPIIIKNLGKKDRKYIYSSKGGLVERSVARKDREKFSVSDKDALLLAKWACVIENHYGMPQDIEWAKDGKTGKLYIVQARPETVHALSRENEFEEYRLHTKNAPLCKGIAVGKKIGQGKARVIRNVAKSATLREGEVLVARMTDPDWVPLMKKASAIVTDEGGRTCHAAIVSRELGIPCVVGTRVGTKIISSQLPITVDCSTGEGRIFSGKLPYKTMRYRLGRIPKLPVKIALNIGTPGTAFQSSFLPVAGVGLARQEFIIAEKIGIHPLALASFDSLKKEKKHARLVAKIRSLIVEHKDPEQFYIKELAEGIAQIASSFYPKEVILRLSDLKSNEYRKLVGGELFEPQEENPMIGWRGASRFVHPDFRRAFRMECKAIRRVREEFGLTNLTLMVPFCRTTEEGTQVLRELAKNGLQKGKKGLKVIVMCEIPSNALLLNTFLDLFDGVSIGSNDLTQLTLGIDRDNAKLAHIGNEMNPAVRTLLCSIIRTCKKRKKYVGICGDAPSTLPGFAEFLMKEGIDEISLSQDVVLQTMMRLGKKKRR